MIRIISAIIVGLARWLTYKSRFESKIDTVLNNQHGHEKRLLKLEIIAAMSRNDRAVVHQLYDEYKALGGNSYMQEMYKEYCKQSNKRSKKC
jgi:hypothetical protein